MKGGNGEKRGGASGTNIPRGERSTTGGGQHPTSNIQHPTSKGEDGQPKAVYDLEERLLAYAVRVVRLVDLLPRSRGADHLGGQVLRSGTSPALNHGEAQAAESLNDFIHKMKICLKELRESRRALRIIAAVPLAEGKALQDIRSLIDETEQLIRIFYAGIRTAEARRAKGEGGGSSRLREDSPEFLLPARDAGNVSELDAIDPITGAQPWMLDVGCWMLDVDRGSSAAGPTENDLARGEAGE